MLPRKALERSGGRPSLAHACPVCDGLDTFEVLNVRGMPVHAGILWSSEAEARDCARGDLAIRACRSCSLVWNAAFDPALMAYSEAYDLTLESSPRFREYAEGLADRLIERYGLRDKSVVEVGCGKGYFLGLMVRRGPNQGLGFDQSFEGNAELDDLGDSIAFERRYFTADDSDRVGDFLCCRHVFEHIDEPVPFLRMIRTAIGEQDCPVYFEVPNLQFVVRDLSIWGLVYEHVTYYSAPALRTVFRRCGFEVLDVREDFEGQFLGIEARPAGALWANDDGAAEVVAGVEGFRATFRQIEAVWRARLDRYERAGKRVVVWGAGAKAVTFMNLLSVGERVSHLVDVNPRKQGRFFPGSGQQIVGPEELASIRPDVVLAMNPIYTEEIRAELSGLGLTPELLTV
jgi:SAM-dependent methyltransferase